MLKPFKLFLLFLAHPMFISFFPPFFQFVCLFVLIQEYPFQANAEIGFELMPKIKLKHYNHEHSKHLTWLTNAFRYGIFYKDHGYQTEI